MQCPLCQFQSSQHYWQDKRRDYWQCKQCLLVYVPPAQRLSAQAEKAEYDLHQNTSEDCGYVTFLSRLATPLKAVLPPGSTGLDFGCGPNPVLANMLREAGHNVHVYDPFYFPDKQVLQQPYDFISCTEAIEHFYQPGAIWKDWMSMLNNQGWLAIMTKRVIDKNRFAAWHYKNDPTHVCFFSDHTFSWLAQHFNMRLEVVGADVVLLQKLT
ncbi:class I SAM-dependent methyltransferase [Lacimicrobium sp. SS2-24]|uniref:class I SAM-dependent methyltransferase n=1 Tax=Lacimicrobium sp. SS2-24 TaxID=2005569 RepID=UPI000B4B84BA|nr:class I SAM-dependent methyltransferase [Lacimicrobium sp. SS2-24]